MAFAAAQAVLAKAEVGPSSSGGARLEQHPESRDSEELQRRLEKAGIRLSGKLPSQLRLAAATTGQNREDHFDSVTPCDSGTTALTTGEMALSSDPTSSS